MILSFCFSFFCFAYVGAMVKRPVFFEPMTELLDMIRVQAPKNMSKFSISVKKVHPSVLPSFR